MRDYTKLNYIRFVTILILLTLSFEFMGIIGSLNNNNSILTEEDRNKEINSNNQIIDENYGQFQFSTKNNIESIDKISNLNQLTNPTFGDLIYKFKGFCCSLAFSPNGRLLASIDEKMSEIILLDLKTSQNKAITLPSSYEMIQKPYLSFSADGSNLAIFIQSTILILDVNLQKFTYIIPLTLTSNNDIDFSSTYSPFVFSTNSNFIAISAVEKTPQLSQNNNGSLEDLGRVFVNIYNLETKEKLELEQISLDLAYDGLDMAFSSDGNLLFGIGQGFNGIHGFVWNSKTGKLIDNNVYTTIDYAKITSSGIIFGVRSSIITKYNILNAQKVNSINLSTILDLNINPHLFSSDYSISQEGNIIALNNHDGKISFFDFNLKHVIGKIENLENLVDFKFSPDGTLFAGVSNNLFIWNVVFGTTPISSNVPINSQSKISHNKKFLIVPQIQKISVYNIENGVLEYSINGAFDDFDISLNDKFLAVSGLPYSDFTFQNISISVYNFTNGQFIKNIFNLKNDKSIYREPLVFVANDILAVPLVNLNSTYENRTIVLYNLKQEKIQNILWKSADENEQNSKIQVSLTQDEKFFIFVITQKIFCWDTLAWHLTKKFSNISPLEDNFHGIADKTTKKVYDYYSNGEMAVTTNQGIEIWNTSNWQLEKNLEIKSNYYQTQISPDNQTLAFIYDKYLNGTNYLVVTSLNNLSERWNIPLHNFLLEYDTMIFTSFGDILVSSSNRLTIWDSNTGNLLQNISIYNSEIFNYPNSQKIVLSYPNINFAKVWDLYIENRRTFLDQDFDGMNDVWEIRNGLDPENFWDKFDDTDNDGVINILEFINNLNPLKIDSNNDGKNDNLDIKLALINYDTLFSSGNDTIPNNGLNLTNNLLLIFLLSTIIILSSLGFIFYSKNKSKPILKELVESSRITSMRSLYHKIIIGLENTRKIFDRNGSKEAIQQIEPRKISSFVAVNHIFPPDIRKEMKDEIKGRTILVLIEIAFQSPIKSNLVCIAEILSISVPTASRDLKKLLDNQYINEISTNESLLDTRYKFYSLTAKGYLFLHLLKESISITLMQSEGS